MQAHTTPNQGKASVNTLQTQSVKSSVTKSMDIQAPTRPVGPFASSLKATEKDLQQKSSTVGMEATQLGSSPDVTENNGGKSTLAKSDRLASSSGKGSKKKPTVDPKKSKPSGGKGSKVDPPVVSAPAPSKAGQAKKIESAGNTTVAKHNDAKDNSDSKQAQATINSSSIEKISKGVKKPKECLDNETTKSAANVKANNTQNKKPQGKEAATS